MIKSFKDKETEKIFNKKISKKFNINISKKAFYQMIDIDGMSDIKDLMSPPSNKLEKLKGNRAEQWSIRVNQQYKICFYWDENTKEAHEVELVDYHK